MAFKLPENVQETTTTEGTGTITLAGAVAGHYPFSSQLSNGDTTFYAILDTVDIEVGIGSYDSSSGQRMSRDSVIYSTNGNALVNWGEGTRNVIIGLPGASLASLLTPGAANGLLAKTAERTYARRSIAVDTDDLQVANANGAAGNPTLALAFAVTAFAKTLLDDATSSAARTTLGLGSAATKNVGTSGDVVVQPNAANVFSAQQTVQRQGIPQTFIGESYGSSAYLNLRSAEGTIAAPAASVDGRILGALLVYGYTGSSFQIGGYISFHTLGKWSDSNRGVIAKIVTTPQGTTSGRVALNVGDGLYMPGASGGDPGNGKMNATEYQINGTPVVSATSTVVMNISANASVGSQGTYATLAQITGATRTQGYTTSGANLRYSDGSNNASGSSPSGTWMLCGSVTGTASSTWKRIDTI